MNVFILLICCLKLTHQAEYYAFRVCGNYCGPGWCNGEWLDEGLCDESVSPEVNNLSCADSCCRSHDSCCGKNKSLQKDCNVQIVNCLSNCNKFSLTCTNNGIPIPAGIIEYSMSIIENWCCGTECN